jgi:hypothetical protein
MHLTLCADVLWSLVGSKMGKYIYPADLFASVCMTIAIFDARVFETDSDY